MYHLILDISYKDEMDKLDMRDVVNEFIGPILCGDETDETLVMLQ